MLAVANALLAITPLIHTTPTPSPSPLTTPTSHPGPAPPPTAAASTPARPAPPSSAPTSPAPRTEFLRLTTPTPSTPAAVSWPAPPVVGRCCRIHFPGHAKWTVEDLPGDLSEGEWDGEG
ncbi:hypothetical protein HDU96_008983 [Phlyctochytrium bullatum]|nr:hypothetical protein HDU96_008983 [Phlyctochytrium bullatum]